MPRPNRFDIYPEHRCRKCGEWGMAIMKPFYDLCERCELLSGMPYRRWTRGRGDGKISKIKPAHKKGYADDMAN